jgi:hypothetical protein
MRSISIQRGLARQLFAEPPLAGLDPGKQQLSGLLGQRLTADLSHSDLPSPRLASQLV